MDWTEIKITVDTKDIDTAGDIANMVVPYGIYIEDYSDLEREAMEIAHIDLIDEELLAKDRTKGIVHIYIDPQDHPQEAAAFLTERLAAAGIENEIDLTPCKNADWENNWKQYFHPIKIGERLLIRPTWEDEYDADGRAVLHLEPGVGNLSRSGSLGRRSLSGGRSNGGLIAVPTHDLLDQRDLEELVNDGLSVGLESLSKEINKRVHHSTGNLGSIGELLILATEEGLKDIDDVVDSSLRLLDDFLHEIHVEVGDNGILNPLEDLVDCNPRSFLSLCGIVSACGGSCESSNAEGENHDERKEKTYDFLHFSTTLSVFNNFKSVTT